MRAHHSDAGGDDLPVGTAFVVVGNQNARLDHPSPAARVFLGKGGAPAPRPFPTFGNLPSGRLLAPFDGRHQRPQRLPSRLLPLEQAPQPLQALERPEGLLEVRFEPRQVLASARPGPEG